MKTLPTIHMMPLLDLPKHTLWTSVVWFNGRAHSTLKHCGAPCRDSHAYPPQTDMFMMSGDVFSNTSDALHHIATMMLHVLWLLLVVELASINIVHVGWVTRHTTCTILVSIP